MNTQGTPEKSSREQLVQWWTGIRPLARRMGPRWCACLVLLAGLWFAGAYSNTRCESLTPQVGLVPVTLQEYVQRGKNIPSEDNAATLYLEAEGGLVYKKNWKSDQEEAFRLCRNFRDDAFKLSAAHWQVLTAFAAETDSVIGQIRGARLRPKCVFPLTDTGHDFFSWRRPTGVEGCLAIRARVAAHLGNAPAWREATNDLLGFFETIGKDPTPASVELQRDSLAALIQGLEEACASGAAGDDSFLAELDGRLAELRPMQAFEPLLALAWSTVDFRHSLVYWGAYPRYFSKKMMEGRTFYPDFLDVPYLAGGFSARDRLLSTAYISELLDVIRSDRPNAGEQAWTLMSTHPRTAGWLGGEFAPRYAEFSRATAQSDWVGSPGMLYSNAACIRMAQAITAVIRQGRDEKGLFRSTDYLKGLLRDLPCPMTGEPIVCRGGAHECSLSYRVSRNPGRYRDYWEIKARLKPPSSGNR